MALALTDTLSQLKHWAQRAVDAGWLTKQSAAQLAQTTAATPSDLFDTTDRPLVISLFGGTGVGKSTLLNRLAGKQIANSSAVRPTSKAITAYRHENTALSTLPDGFPVDSLNTATHAEDQFQSILWVDMPDFDSVEENHQRMVKQWLPYIDVVLYVVSPDRYRDDKGWRLLLEHSAQHAWAFIINHWDRGDERQRADFITQLNSAGLSDPVVFCTDSSNALDSIGEQAKPADDFDALKAHLTDMANAALVARLEERGVLQRARLLAEVAGQWQADLGSSEVTEALLSEWEEHINAHRGAIVNAHRWKIAPLAKQFDTGSDSALSTVIQRRLPIPALLSKDSNDTATGSAALTAPNSMQLPELIDQSLLDDLHISTEQYIQKMHQAEFPLIPLKKQLQAGLADSSKTYDSVVHVAVQESLAQPGTSLQRGLYKLTGLARTLLPLATMGWVGYRLVSVFQTSGGNPGAYLGGNFAVHSALLIGLAWLIPFVLHRQLKPSPVKAAARGLLKGLNNAIGVAQDKVSDAIQQVQEEQSVMRSELLQITDNLQHVVEQDLPESVQRMVFPNRNSKN